MGNTTQYEDDEDEDFSQYKFVKSRMPKKEKKKVQKSRWDDDYGYYERR